MPSSIRSRGTPATWRLPWYTPDTGESYFNYALGYLRALEAQVPKRYDHTIWPPHCIIGSDGNMLMPRLLQAVSNWERRYLALAMRHGKGSCWACEHFGAVKAEVPYKKGPSTGLNIHLVRTLATATKILVAGWATDYCLRRTVEDTAAAFLSGSARPPLPGWGPELRPAWPEMVPRAGGPSRIAQR